VITTCTIKRDVDQWYACFTVDPLEKHPLPPSDITTAVGVDVGLTHLLALNTGKMIENPRWFRTSEKKLAKEQRKLSKKKKGSHNRDKQHVKVAQVYRTIRNQRKDVHHKISRHLVESYELIVYEDLTITNMVKNPHLAKSISDADWAQLMSFTQYKAEEAGSRVEYVNADGTTQVCIGVGSWCRKP
jgi:putative transposase